MRSFLQVAGTVTAAALTVFTAGCSSAQQNPLAAGTAGKAMPAPFLPAGRITPLRLHELQARGELPGPVSQAALERGLDVARNRRSIQLEKRHAGKVGLWISDTNENYLIGFNAAGKQIEGAISGSANGCFMPVTVKIDAARNIWTACESNAAYTGNVLQEYNSAGKLQTQYSAACPIAGTAGCKYWYAYGYDGAADAQDVFIALTFWELNTCSPNCLTYGGGFEWWPTGSPSATPTLIALPYGKPVIYVDYMDLDPSGNIWFDYYGCTTTANCGYGLGEIENPTSASWTFVSILPPGSLGLAGGVYVGGGGKTLSVTDQKMRTISQYALPLSPSGSPARVLGPTPLNYFGDGDPVSGGYNANDTSLAQGDAAGWLDLGNVAKNKWKANVGLDIRAPEGAAYTPSDR